MSVLSRTAKEIGINRTTLMRLLATLEREAIIERRREGIGYALGPGVRRLCAGALFGSDIVKIADPILIALTAQLGLSSHLAELDGRSALYLLRRVPNAHLVSSIQIGTRVDAHTVNAGRIILAHWPEDQVRALYKGVKLKRVTDQTPDTLKKLLDMLRGERRLGLSWSDSGFEIGISSVAAPVFGSDGRAMASINVTGHTSAFDTNAGRRDLIAKRVAEAADEISRQLGASIPELHRGTSRPSRARSSR